MPQLTRDSWIWPCAALASILTYLSANDPPTQWDYYQWVAGASFLVAMVSGYLNKSPLPAGAAK